jgi:hypothetical protein
MRDLLQTVIPVMVTAVVAGWVAVTRTGRLRKDIRENLDLLGQLPADHPNRATLEAHNGELLGLLVRRQQRRYGPFTQAGVLFGALGGVASVALAFACFTALLATGVIPSASASSPLTPGNQWVWVAFFLVMWAGCAVFAVRAAQQQLREHPPPAQQPTEAG